MREALGWIFLFAIAAIAFWPALHIERFPKGAFRGNSFNGWDLEND